MRHRHLAVLLMLTWFGGSFCLAGDSGLKSIWRSTACWGITDSSPVVIDADGDGDDDIIFGTATGKVIALDEAQKIIWERMLDHPVTCAPAVTQNADGKPECLVLDNSGRLTCLDATTGETKWDFTLSAEVDWGHTTPAVGDINNDSIHEILLADKGGNVVCLTGEGETVWSVHGDHGNACCPALVDLDGDGMLEILIAGTKRAMTCFQNDGTVRWSVDGDQGGTSPHVADLNGDGKPEILFAIDRHFQVLDRSGKALWTRDLGAKIDSGVTVVDLNGNGKPEILIPDLKNTLHVLDGEGNPLWEASIKNRCRRNPAVADIDGDGAMEILLTGYSGVLYVFSAEGQLRQTVSLSSLGSAINTTPTLLDFDNDKTLDMVCCVCSGEISRFEWTKAGPDAKVLCAEYRGGGDRAGFFGKKKADAGPRIGSWDLGKLFVGNNLFSCAVENPKTAEIAVQLTITIDEKQPFSMVETSSERQIAVSFPYAISAKTTQKCLFEVSIRSKGKVISSRKLEVEVVPFMREIATADLRLASLKALLPQLDQADRLQERFLRLEKNYQELRDRALMGRVLESKEQTALRDKMGLFVKEVVLLEKMARMAKQIDEKTPGRVLAVLANPWAPYGGMEELREGRVESLGGIEALQGESEAAAVNLFNLSDTARTFRVTLPPNDKTQGDFAPAPTDAVQLREVLAVPTQMYDKEADALPKLNQAQTITVPAWGARQLWVDVDTKYFKPGEQEIVLNFKSLDIEPVAQSVKIPMTVWSASMPAKHPFKLCHWGYVDRSILKDQPKKAVQDQIELLTSIYVCTIPPTFQFNEKGEIVSTDFSALDAYLDLYLVEGNEPIILLFHYQGGVRGPAKPGSEAYRKAYIAGLRKLVKHLESRGLTYDNWALYPVDEPGLTAGRVEQQIFHGKLAREADPKIKNYTDPVGRLTLEELDAMNPYIDIWCPNLTDLLLDQNQEKLDRIKSYGEPMWTYTCMGNAKHRTPIAYYRATAWLAWHHGITGTGFWSYCTARNDPWFRPAVNEDYLFLYPGDGVVHSKRWNAIRDAIEDYSLFVMLQEAADKAEATKTKPEAVAQARTLLGGGVYSVGVYPGLNGEKNDAEPDGPGATRLREDTRWKNLRQVRRDMVNCLQALTDVEKK